VCQCLSHFSQFQLFIGKMFCFADSHLFRLIVLQIRRFKALFYLTQIYYIAILRWLIENVKFEVLIIC
jgi:hypothetical protein